MHPKSTKSLNGHVNQPPTSDLPLNANARWSVSAGARLLMNPQLQKATVCSDTFTAKTRAISRARDAHYSSRCE